MSATAAISSLLPVIPLDAYKKPIRLDWTNIGVGEYPPVGNFGFRTLDIVLVLDFDQRNYPFAAPGDPYIYQHTDPDTGLVTQRRDMLQEVWEAWLKNVATYTVKTPRGGYHFYFRKPADRSVKKEQPEYPGIDFLTNGAHQVCADGTTTIANGKTTVDGTYACINPATMAEIPEAFLAGLKHKAEALAIGIANETLLSLPKFEAECKAHPKAVQGNKGNDTTYALACKGRDYGLPVEQAYASMRDIYSPRCEPEWEDGELWALVNHAYKHAKNAPGNATPEAKFRPSMVPAQVATTPVSIQEFQHRGIIETVHQKQVSMHHKTGRVLNTQANVVYFLREHKYWKGRILYNQFADVVEVKGRPDWRREETDKHEGLTKRDFAFMQAWFSANEDVALEVPENRLDAACFAAATPYHPVRDYLNELVWDGTARLDTFLRDTTSCEDNVYTRAAGVCTMISAVKRIFEPGCKQDYVLVLESSQGEKKSQWVEILGGQWHSTGDLVPGDKDTYQVLRGKWIVELPEIDAIFSKADFAWLKKVITTSSDTYRPSYERRSRSVPRESIFIATLNPNAAGEYLKDFENRRYWPVKTGRLNIEHLRKWRDQYFAEAVHRYRAGEQSWISDVDIIAIAKAEQQARRETDPWVEILNSWAKMRDSFSIAEAYGSLGLTAAQINSRHRTRVYTALRDLGWDYSQDFAGGRWTKRKLTLRECV